MIIRLHYKRSCPPGYLCFESKSVAVTLLITMFLLIFLTMTQTLLKFHNYGAASTSSNNSIKKITQYRTGSGEKAFFGLQQADKHGDEEIRLFQPYGSATALFVVYGAYRGGSNTFAVVGLGPKPLYTFGDPQFECYWVPSSSSREPIKSEMAYRMLPDVNYGRVYTVVVVNCSFQEPVGTSSSQKGGQLILYASHGDGLGKPAERIVALTEDENSYNSSLFEPPYPYEFVYCGSPLFGNLNANRIREWIAYHVMLFGPKSHFIFHDAGGMHAEVRAVLEPWKKLGYITVQNVRQQAQYDGYYYNQFLILNDCLHRTKFMANWTFFFDVDEYIYIAPEVTFHSVMGWHANVTMLQLNQVRMSDKLCQTKDRTVSDSRNTWGFEKLVYRDKQEDYVKTAPKYAVQGRGVFATGVHRSQIELGHMEGEEGWAWWPQMRYYHYHNTICKQEADLCMELAHTNNTSASTITFDGTPFELDTSMVSIGPLIKQFEVEQIGHHSHSMINGMESLDKMPPQWH